MVLEITGGIGWVLSMCHVPCQVLMCISQFHPLDSAKRWALFTPFCRWANWGWEKLNNWTRVPQLVSGPSAIRTQVGSDCKVPVLNHYMLVCKVKPDHLRGCMGRGQICTHSQTKSVKKENHPTWRSFGEAEEILTASHRLFTSSLSSSAKVKVQGGVSRILQSPQKSL